MANRKLPFGYKMQRGKIHIHEQEADIVREIYAEYTAGASYQQLARSLNSRKLPYSDPAKPWNKNMIARIINSAVYTGNESSHSSRQLKSAPTKPLFSTTKEKHVIVRT